jgi:hydrogenase maturation protease
MIRVIGIGSPFGDDRAGLEVAARLAGLAAPDLDVIRADRPGVDLVELLRGVDAAIVVDAVRSGAPAGTLHDLDLSAVPHVRLRYLSSHGFGVAEALALAQALGRMPGRGRLIGIEVADVGSPSCARLSPAIERALDDALGRVHAWLDYFGAITGTSGNAPRTVGDARE